MCLRCMCVTRQFDLLLLLLVVVVARFLVSWCWQSKWRWNGRCYNRWCVDGRWCGNNRNWNWGSGDRNCGRGRVNWRVVANLRLKRVTANVGRLANNLVGNLLVANNGVSGLHGLQDSRRVGDGVHVWRLGNQALAVHCGQSWHGGQGGHLGNCWNQGCFG